MYGALPLFLPNSPWRAFNTMVEHFLRSEAVNCADGLFIENEMSWDWKLNRALLPRASSGTKVASNKGDQIKVKMTIQWNYSKKKNLQISVNIVKKNAYFKFINTFSSNSSETLTKVPQIFTIAGRKKK